MALLLGGGEFDIDIVASYQQDPDTLCYTHHNHLYTILNPVCLIFEGIVRKYTHDVRNEKVYVNIDSDIIPPVEHKHPIHRTLTINVEYGNATIAFQGQLMSSRYHSHKRLQMVMCESSNWQKHFEHWKASAA
jgi:hypothetical protein